MTLAEIARLCRLRMLQLVYEAGRGHLGTSFSSMDIIVAVRSIMGPNDIFLSSKGHDAPAQYAVLEHYGILRPGGKLRVEGGLPGHPTIDVPGIVANTGSLGMGLSKATGFVWAKRMSAAQGGVELTDARGHTVTYSYKLPPEFMEECARSGVIVMDAKGKGRVFVLLGDGEMSEGQNYEAMNFAAKHSMHEILAVVDCNGYSQDGPAMLSAARIRNLFRAAGWVAAIVADADADDLAPLIAADSKTPRALIVRTRKGLGSALLEADPAKWHQRAPTPEEYKIVLEELSA